MPNRYPSRLKKSPIINCVCEIRYVSDTPVEMYLPGLVHAGLNGQTITHPVPPIPPEIVKNDPNMQGIPSFTLGWGNFLISGNFSYVSVSYLPPYDRWTTFYDGVSRIYEIILKSNLFSAIKRYSIKYVDFIELPQSISAMDLLNIEIAINNLKVQNQNTVLRVEQKNNKYLHVLNIATSATLQDTTGVRNGMLIDTDSLHILDDPILPNNFLTDIKERFDNLHAENKDLFFSLLSQKAIDLLEPEYDNN